MASAIRGGFHSTASDIGIADVGQNAGRGDRFPRMSTTAKGVNFGWPQYEGASCSMTASPAQTPPKFPILVYTHNNGGCAVIGGYVSHDPQHPALKGHYLYGDLCTGQLRSIPVPTWPRKSRSATERSASPRRI